VLAEHLVAQLAELDEELRARARRRRVRLLLLEVARRAIPIRLVDGDRAQRGERRQVRRIEIERHLEALARLHAIGELLVERLADAVVHLDALHAVGREIGDARHRVDGLRRVALLLVELGERVERRTFVSSRSTMFR
jgi:nucleoside-diphosphate-sugar epimerase